jgi:hypothetical protein
MLCLAFAQKRQGVGADGGDGDGHGGRRRPFG